MYNKLSINKDVADAEIDLRMKQATIDEERALRLLQRMCDHNDINFVFDRLGASTVTECKKCGFTIQICTQTELDK